MSEGQSLTSGQVVIVGGGVAALEALIALRALVGDLVAVTLVSQDEWFVDRPATVAEPFGTGISSALLAAGNRRPVPCAVCPRGTVADVDGAEHRVSCAGGPDLGLRDSDLGPRRAQRDRSLPMRSRSASQGRARR